MVLSHLYGRRHGSVVLPSFGNYELGSAFALVPQGHVSQGEPHPLRQRLLLHPGQAGSQCLPQVRLGLGWVSLLPPDRQVRRNTGPSGLVPDLVLPGDGPADHTGRVEGGADGFPLPGSRPGEATLGPFGRPLGA